jgi:hypothetical protein
MLKTKLMIVFTLNGTKYTHPEDCQDVTVQQVIEFYRDVYPTRPALILELTEAVNEEPINENRVAAIEKKMQSKVWISAHLYPYMCRVVKHFCGVDGITLGQTSPAHLEYLYHHCIGAMRNPGDVQYKQLYLIDGEVYKLPTKLMSQSTLQEFAEAAQYEENAEQIKDGNWEGLLNVCSVILRKENEEYSEEVYNRNRDRFRTLPLQTLYEVGFFLKTLSLNYVLGLNLSLLKRAVQELQAT